jgi:hypothetical protein
MSSTKEQSTYQGPYEVWENELVLHGITLVNDFSGPTTVFSYERPAPDSKTVQRRPINNSLIWQRFSF